MTVYRNCLFSDIDPNTYSVTITTSGGRYIPKLGQCMSYLIVCNCYDGEYSISLTLDDGSQTANWSFPGVDGYRSMQYNAPCGFSVLSAQVTATKG